MLVMNKLRIHFAKKNIKLRRTFSFLFVLFICIACPAFLISTPSKESIIDVYYVEQLKNLKREIGEFKGLAAKGASSADLKKQFTVARTSYKRLAVLTEYFNRYETRLINGPALNWVAEDNPDAIIPPHGFQLIEEYLYRNWSTARFDSLSTELQFILDAIARLENEPDRGLKFKDEYVFEALRSSVVRITTLGITGFDSPVSTQSISEAMASLDGIENILHLYQPRVPAASTDLNNQLLILLNKSRDYLSSHPDFNSFDRLDFIVSYANPLYSAIGKLKGSMGVPDLQGKKPIDPNATSIFDENAFDLRFFSPDEQYQLTKERIELGKMLFNDPILSSGNSRSCATCHKPELAFTDGSAVPTAMDGKTSLTRNTPTLINTVFQTRQFYDSRTDMLENQLDEVIHNPNEMKGSLKQSIDDLKKHPVYKPLFQKAYADNREPFSPYNIANAISSYVRSLVAMNARFDQYVRGNANALTNEEKKGFNLFAGKAKCATCHFIPLFNGLVPPEFNETESEVLGVPVKNDKKKAALDPDLGKYGFTRAEVHKYAFKIPTLRNIELTAPYMHNGVFKTLEQVVEFYNEGGGYGWKTAPPNQTLPPEKLHLNTREKKQLIAFMKTLTDTKTGN